MLSELSPTSVLTLILVILTLIGVAVGRYPWLRMNRATIALVGGTLAVVIGAMTLEQAYAALDLNTLVLLFAMMVLNVNLRLAGFFRLISTRVVQLARSPRQLLALLILAAGVLSALFLNDTIVLMLTPLVLEVTVTLKRNPIPLAAMTAAAILLITRRLRPERVFEEIDWGLLIFFAGLFIVTGALETSGLSEQLFALLRPLAEQGVAP